MGENKFRIELEAKKLVPSSQVRNWYLISLVGVVGLVVGVVGLWQYLPQVVPFWFSEPWGEARLAPKIYLVILPVLALLVICINVMLGRIIQKENKVLWYALAIGAMVVTWSLLLGLYGIGQSLL